MTALKELVERLLNARDEGQNYIVLSTSSASREENAETLARAAIDHLSSDLSSLERMREALQKIIVQFDELPAHQRGAVIDTARQALSPVAPESES